MRCSALNTAFLKDLAGGLLLLTALSFLPGQANAQTIGYADAMKLLTHSCGKDIARHCKNVNLGSGRIESCLANHASSISASCKADYVTAYAMLAARFAAQETAPKLCAGDIRRLCPDITRGKGYTLKCLLNKRRRTIRGEAWIDAEGYLFKAR